MFISPYQTTSFKQHRFNKIGTTIKQLEIMDELIPLDSGINIKAIPSSIKDLAPFSLWVTNNEVQNLSSDIVVDGRPFLNGSGNVSNQSLHDFYVDTGILIKKWMDGGQYDVLSAGGDLAVKIYSQMFRNLLSARLNLDFNQTYLIQAVGAIFFIQLCTPITSNSNGTEYDRVITRAARALPMTDFLSLQERVGDVPPLNDLEDAVNWIKEIIKSPRIEALNMAHVRQSTLNLWTSQYKELSACAIEYPPLFISMMYHSIKSQGFVRSNLGELIKKSVRPNDSQSFIRSMDTYLRN